MPTSMVKMSPSGPATTTSVSSLPYDPMYTGDDSAYPYANHTLVIDVKSPTFTVIYTDFKNKSNDLVINATSTQTLFPDGKVEILEGKYRSIIYNDKNMTVESFIYEFNEKSISWYDGDCYIYQSQRLNDSSVISISKSCNNGSYLFFYGEPKEALPAGESYLTFSENL